MQISAVEQYLLELINRARLDPQAEADRLGIDLNEGLSPGQLNGDAKQPLAHDDLLANAAEDHSDWMLANDTFSHTGAGGSDPGERMSDAGYVFSGIWTWGENLAWYGTTGTLDLAAAVEIHNDGLFLSSGHRANTMHKDFREIGIAQVQGEFTHSDNTTYDASMLTEKFAKSGSDIFVTGVVYNDADADGFYSIGEAVSGIYFDIGRDTGSSASAGGYKVAALANSAVDVAVTGGGINAHVRLDPGSENAKLDIVDGIWALSSADLELISGMSNGALLGVADLNATGDDTHNRLNGNKGDNILSGGAGDDILMGGAGEDTLNGDDGSDTASYANAGSAVFVRLWSGEGLSGDAAGDALSGIENIEGSDYADTLAGDGRANVLSALGGVDTIWAGDGDDVLRGGAGADILNGQGGRDTASYADADGSIFVRLWSGEGLSGEAAGDVLNDIENLEGSGYADTLTGDETSNLLSGLAGDDELWASDGDDTLKGGEGADTLFGQRGIDTASYEDADDGVFVRLWSREGLSGEALGDVLNDIENLEGSNFADTLVGDSGVNLLSGRGGTDALWGGDGDDVLMGGAGADFLQGQGGSDTASYAEADGGVFVRLWSREGLSGEASGDVLSSIENLEGSSFSDTLVGDSAGNRLTGGGGGDALWAGDGDDILIGGAGGDVLNGQGGADIFVFGDGSGQDSVADWQDDLDRLSFDVGGVSGFGDLSVNVVGGNTLVQASDVTAVLLNWRDGIDGTLNEFDFI